MPTMFAQPYDLEAKGFYFDNFDSYIANMNADVEEYEIQFIDGDSLDCELAEALDINQANVNKFFDVCDEWSEHDKIKVCIAAGELGESFDLYHDSPDDCDIDYYEGVTMRELAEQFVDEGLFGDIPESIANYIDYEAIARDLRHDYTETEIAGNNIIYRAG